MPQLTLGKLNLRRFVLYSWFKVGDIGHFITLAAEKSLAVFTRPRFWRAVTRLLQNGPARTIAAQHSVGPLDCQIFCQSV